MYKYMFYVCIIVYIYIWAQPSRPKQLQFCGNHTDLSTTRCTNAICGLGLFEQVYVAKGQALPSEKD